MTVGTIQHHSIHALRVQSGNPVQSVGSDTHSGGDPEPSLCIFAGHRMEPFLDKVFVGDQTDNLSCLVHYGELFDLILLQDGLNLLAVSVTVQYCHQILTGHSVFDEHCHIFLEADVTVGHDAHQMALPVSDGNASDMVVVHQGESVAHCLVLIDSHRVADHSVLAALYLAHLGGLGGYAHILVNHSYSSLPCKGDGHRRLGDCIHCGRHNGDIQSDVSREATREADFPRKHFRIGGNQKDIIESEAFKSNFFIYK